MNDFSANKGEWSEPYVLFKLLAEGKLHAANAQAEKICNSVYQVIEIIRKEHDQTLRFLIVNDKVCVYAADGRMLTSFPVVRFRDEAEYLYKEIRKNKKTSFRIIKTSRFLEDIMCQQLKARSSDKADIHIKIHDVITASTPTLGFSIKSNLGKSPTLLNASKLTNFIFSIKGPMDDVHMDSINKLMITKTKTRNDIKTSEEEIALSERLSYLSSNKLLLEYNDIEYNDKKGPVFKNNLTLIDSRMPEIIAELLRECFCNGKKAIGDALNAIQIRNPLEFDCSTTHNYYRYKVKKFLSEVALGMIPKKVWTGLADATGGYIIVREDGEIVCYHLYNRNAFEDYLVENTRFESPSASRHGFASVEKRNGDYFFKLNLQIRFI